MELKKIISENENSSFQCLRHQQMQIIIACLFVGRQRAVNGHVINCYYCGVQDSAPRTLGLLLFSRVQSFSQYEVIDVCFYHSFVDVLIQYQ